MRRTLLLPILAVLTGSCVTCDEFIRRPTAPLRPIAKAQDRQAFVTWQPPDDNGGAAITTYTVTSNPEAITVTTDGAPEVTVTGLTNGVRYTFTITATNSKGEGDPSEPSNAVTPATTPGAPTAVQAVAGDGLATVQWIAPGSDGGSAITKYTVTSIPGGLTAATTGATQTVVTGLQNSVSYAFTVVATNAMGDGPPSAPSNAVTPASTTCASTGGFVVPTHVPAGANPEALATADFNGDGNPDLAVALGGTGPGSAGMSVLLGNGDGTFRPAVPYSAPTEVYKVVSADFNGDGMPDVGAARLVGSNTYAWSVWLGHGDGTFGSAIETAVGSYSQIQAVDLDGDGKVDLIAGASSGSIAVRLGNGDGTFQAPVLYPIGAAAVLSIGDVNGDGHPDVLLAIPTTNSAGIMLSNGDGTLQPIATFPAGPVMLGAISTDFDGDGKVDLAIGNLSTLSILKGNGDGTFQAPAVANLVDRLAPLASADFNGDGIVDLVTIDVDSFGVSVLLGRGDGTFQQGPATAWTARLAAAVGDFDGDGKMDVAGVAFTSNDPYGDVGLFFGNGRGTFSGAESYPGPPVALSLTSADFDGDGIPDFAAGVYANPVYMAFWSGTAGGGLHRLANRPEQGLFLAPGDFNADGRPDLMACCDATSFLFLPGNGDGTFQAPTNVAAGFTGVPISGDFNGDGKLDVAAFKDGGTVANVLRVALGNGDGTFQIGPSTTFDGLISIAGLATGDFNGDGKLDLAGLASNVLVFLGNGDGTFQAPAAYGPNASTTGTLVAADVDGDGHLDLVAAQGTVTVLLGNGDGTFRAGVAPPVDQLARAVVTTDFDGDGTADLAVGTELGGSSSNPSGGAVDVFYGRGDGTWRTPLRVLVGGGPKILEVADMDRDGRPDLIVNILSGQLAVVRQRTCPP